MPISSLLLSSLGGTLAGGGGGGLANIAGGLLGGVTGFFQRRKAKKALSNLQRPQYQIPNEILQNQKQAELAANEGLPAEQYAKGMQDISRRQNELLSGATSRRSGLMALPALQQQSNDATLNLNIANANAKKANRQILYGINNQVAGYRDKAFDINQMQPYQRDYNYNMQLLGAGNQNMFSGAEKFLGGVLGSGNPFGIGGNASSGGSRKMTSGKANAPTYYGDYSPNSDYSSFETGYPS